MYRRIEAMDEQLAELEEELLNEQDEDTKSVDIPVAGRTNSEMTEVRRTEPETWTEEVPIEGSQVDDPETVTVERSYGGPSVEDIEEFNGKLNQMRSETSRQQKERANQRREEQAKRGGIPQYSYVNQEDRDIDESNIPVPGEGKQED